MLALNRSALVVRPRSPFLDWLHAVDPTSASLTLGHLTREPTIYLVSECGGPDDKQAYLQAVFSTAGGGIGRRGRRPGPWTSSRAGLTASFIRCCSI
jgi:hypothetical protein